MQREYLWETYMYTRTESHTPKQRRAKLRTCARTANNNIKKHVGNKGIHVKLVIRCIEIYIKREIKKKYRKDVKNKKMKIKEQKTT